MQYALQLVQVFFVGLTLGMTRTVVPAVAESDFGVPRGDLALLTTFVIAFGLVKGLMNFIAGAMSESLGRKRVLVIGWIIALPIPWMIGLAPRAGGWGWIVAATVLLGVNQGLTWSMTLTSKLDLTSAGRRGLTNGLNEFAGYGAVAIAGIVTAWLSDRIGARHGLLAFGCAAILPALFVAILFVQETRLSPLAHCQKQTHTSNSAQVDVEASAPALRTRDVVALSVRDRTFFALCQAGLVEKFIDAMFWIVVPVYLTSRGVDLRDVGWTPGVYAMTWGCSQLVTGSLSDRIGRKPLISGGMLLAAAGIAVLPLSSLAWWWNVCAAATGLGMGMLYPTLSAAVSDLASDAWRGAALGVYRFWRDAGYAVGAGVLALLALGEWPLPATFWAIAFCVAISAIALMLLARETRGGACR